MIVLGIILIMLSLLGFICGLIFPFIFKNINWIFLILTLFLIAPGIAILKGEPCEVPTKQDVIDDPVKIYENSMKSKELTIKIPKGQEIDWQESAKQEKIVFKNINTKPRSWKEYFEQYKNTPCYELGFDVSGGYWSKSTIYENGYCSVPSRELAEAFLAMMQLMSLRQAWIGDWKPDWSCGYSSNYCVVGADDRFDVCILSKCRYALSFPAKEMAEDFMNTFKDLLEIAKPLI